MRLPILLAAILTHSLAPAADQPPIQVFLLVGQSNMQGHGRIAADPEKNAGRGSLEFVAKDPGSPEEFRALLTLSGEWTTRDDVFITYLDRHGPLTVGYGANSKSIGPELGFGMTIGDHISAPVLLIKAAWGGKSLAVDFRPPSRGPLTYSLGEKQDAALAADPELLGRYYRETLRLTRAALTDVRNLVPDSAGRTVELAGIAWHQGWNDRVNDKHCADYEENLVALIHDLRRDLGRPNLPFAIAETGQGGPEEMHARALALMHAQATAAARPEFQGNVAFVPTRSFWRPADHSPTSQGYHWNSNAESYYLIGQALALALIQLPAPTR